MRRTLSLAAFACLTASAADAHAWYFPEHVAIENDAIAQLSPGIRAALDGALAKANTDGLVLCPDAGATLEGTAVAKRLQTRMIRSKVSVPCVPYAALPALAGDHASSAAELRTVLKSGKGIEITSAVAYEWGRFREAVAKLPNTPLERMSFVHELDVAFYFIDPGYELRAQATRAHFVDAGRPLEEVVRSAATSGSVDNSLGQFLAHHIRSLELAARGEASESVLEHGFAMHFLEDAFAAGHLVMTERLWLNGNPRARRRHDFFDAKGLPVRRAMSVESCDSLARGPRDIGLLPCWVTSGDGYLGLTPDASDRLHASRAIAKAELQFALASDPKRVVSAIEALGEREQLAIGELLEPSPWWTARSVEQQTRCATAPRAVRLARAAAKAVVDLAKRKPMAEVVVGKPQALDLFDAELLTRAIDPYVSRDEVEAELVDDADASPTDRSRVLALGTVGVSFVRPLLVEWPAAQADPDALEGEAKLDLGWAVQLLASTSGAALFPPRAPVSFVAPAIGVSAGLSYRWGTYLPGRLDRSVAELNIGISEALHYNTEGRANGRPQVTMLDQELRFPIIFEVLTSYLLPLDLSRGHDAGRVVFFSGIRTHEVLTGPSPKFWGAEIEAAAIALTQGRGAYPLYAQSPEVRFYIGVADPSVIAPSLPSTWAPTFGVALTGGYATFL